jgi:tetratricopeptide (TPR) repeat protein
MHSRYLLLLVALLSAGCITVKPRSHRPSTSAVVLADVPVRQWGDNTCGAGALSTVLNYFRHPATEDDLNARLKKGRHGGIVSIDLLLEARNRGFEARLVKGTPELIEESVRSGSPPILMLRVLDAPGAGNDLFHYIVVDGYDAQRKLARTQFGDGTLRWASLVSSSTAPIGGGLQRAWEGTDYATLVIQPPDGTSRDQAAELRQAVLLEESGRLDEARAAYREYLHRYPESSVGWTNLGNVEAQLGRYAEAESGYRNALRHDPRNRDAVNNLAWFLLQMQRLEEAEHMARRAEAMSGPDSYTVLDTLGEILMARQKCAEAMEVYSKALAAVPANHPSAREKLLQSLDVARAKCG